MKLAAHVMLCHAARHAGIPWPSRHAEPSKAAQTAMLNRFGKKIPVQIELGTQPALYPSTSLRSLPGIEYRASCDLNATEEK
jgi:hypothetical protein